MKSSNLPMKVLPSLKLHSLKLLDLTDKYDVFNMHLTQHIPHQNVDSNYFYAIKTVIFNM